MGLFGGSSSKSYSTSIMQDQRVAAEEVETQIGAYAEVAMPGAIQISEHARVGDILIQEYTPEVQETISEVVETFAETSERVTEALGTKLLQTQQGIASILPQMAVYGVIAVVVIVIAGKIWK
jgi:Mg2+ and Co2+ transporter CorA